MRGFVDQILTKDKGANVIVLGDINDFDFSETTDILVGSGKTALIDLPRTLPLQERYSYVFEGNSQILDQILISKNLQPASSYDIVHMNAEFPDQISDHDPQVVRVIPRPSRGALTSRESYVGRPGGIFLARAPMTGRRDR